MPEDRWQLWIDTGGTFTDCLALAPAGEMRRIKVLSTSSLRGTVRRQTGARVFTIEAPLNVPDDFFIGMTARVLGAAEGGEVIASTGDPLTLTLASVPAGWAEGAAIELCSAEEAPVLAARLATRTPGRDALPPMSLDLATTKGTNALLEEKGAPVLFCGTEGFGDLLRIGDQRRPELFARNPRRPEPLHAAVAEVPGRLDAEGNEIRAFDAETFRRRVAALPPEHRRVAVVALLHSDLDPAHERAAARVLRELGAEYVVTSVELAARIKILPRADTALVDAYLGPLLKSYLDDVAGKLGTGSRLRVMTSAGGLVPRSDFRPKDGLLSGPAGGLVGAAHAAQAAGHGRALIFDMGGTSTDVARWDGAFEPAPSHRVGRAQLLAPALEIESVAAGGGSACRFAPGTASFQVGPESAGAQPGPACYGAGGPLTLTDVNLLLGRLEPAAMSIPVDLAAARARLEEILAASGETDPREVLAGLVRIADEHMADAVRTISVREGYDPAEYALVAFGGAGGLHACGVAELLGIKTVLYPPDSGLLSARGLAEAVPEREAERQVLRPLAEAQAGLGSLLESLDGEAKSAFGPEEIPAGTEADFVLTREAELRLAGQDSTLRMRFGSRDELAASFETRYRSLFNYYPADREIELVAVRVRASLCSPEAEEERFAPGAPVEPDHAVGCPLDAARSVPVHRREALAPGNTLAGPAVVQDGFSTLYLAPGWTAEVGSRGTIVLKRAEKAIARQVGAAAAPEAVTSELFRHRFAHLVGEMGEMLRRTALSTNVKERLDFSCALLSPAAELVMNAPHIPVHLGAMGVCARRVLALLPLEPGDVAVLNHPAAGGSHLPDVTLLMPVFAGNGKTLLGYVANRAHHAEIGGTVPGSMPAGARTLAEEGVVIAPRKLVAAGEARWEEMRELLSSGPHPSRRPEENLADLHAQLASLNRGAELLRAMAAAAGAEAVTGQMGRLLEATAQAAVEALRAHLGDRRTATVTETLDDGTPVCVAFEGRGEGRWRLDFAGTGGGARVHPGNFNATEAVVRSAVMYALRLLVGGGFELNEGLMRPVEVALPECFLHPRFDLDNPSRCPAVVAGNVETSQRVVDALLRALGLAACSQGTMNNLIFGNERCSYYETIGGGAGATAEGPGASALHTHMTNTAITDPEVLERRYPVRLERFGHRAGSGGAGRHRGGEGIVRELVFLEPMEVNLLTQHRVEAPYGLEGGQPGATGRQTLVRATGEAVPLEGCADVKVRAGDRLIIETPGGGGYGYPPADSG